MLPNTARSGDVIYSTPAPGRTAVFPVLRPSSILSYQGTTRVDRRQDEIYSTLDSASTASRKHLEIIGQGLIDEQFLKYWV